MCNGKILRTIFSISALLALSACFNLPLQMEGKANGQQYTADGRLLVNIQIDMGGGGGGDDITHNLPKKTKNNFLLFFAKPTPWGILTTGRR
jgi:hypothetical protein